MLAYEIGIFLVTALIGLVAYRLGRRDGYDEGFMDGHGHATEKMLPVSHVNTFTAAKRVYDYTREGF